MSSRLEAKCLSVCLHSPCKNLQRTHRYRRGIFPSKHHPLDIANGIHSIAKLLAGPTPESNWMVNVIVLVRLKFTIIFGGEFNVCCTSVENKLINWNFIISNLLPKFEENDLWPVQIFKMSDSILKLQLFNNCSTNSTKLFFFNFVPLLLAKVASGTDSAYAALPDMLSCICSGCWTSRKRNSKFKFDSNDTTLFDMINACTSMIRHVYRKIHSSTHLCFYRSV